MTWGNAAEIPLYVSWVLSWLEGVPLGMRSEGWPARKFEKVGVTSAIVGPSFHTAAGGVLAQRSTTAYLKPEFHRCWVAGMPGGAGSARPSWGFLGKALSW
jgi:hypothetical protein